MRRFALLLLTPVLANAALAQALPPVPEPAENPTTEEKRVLGKILFWDEQLSSDNSIACGTCHKPAFGGADPRLAAHPGPDGEVGTRDDVFGSPGVVHLDADGNAALHPVFRTAFQTTERATPSNFGALWADAQFWDGRAGTAFVDPLTEETLIAAGASLETQALEPILNTAEMAHHGRDWADVTGKLETATPLALADRIPPDMAAALADGTRYTDLFAAAFGDRAITPTRIAYALAAYQRTLVADQTPWDAAQAGGEALSIEAEIGFSWFKQQRCDACHVPPLFTSNGYFNVGLRPAADDDGRAEVTGDAADAGRMKVPSLRNVALRPRFTHTGEVQTLEEMLGLYFQARAARDTLPGGGQYLPNVAGPGTYYIKIFLATLTDPRAANEEFPFDKPRLRSERGLFDAAAPDAPADLAATPVEGGVRLAWTEPADDEGVADYVIRRDGAVIGYASETSFLDPAPNGGVYSVVARDAPRRSSAPAEIDAPALE